MDKLMRDYSIQEKQMTDKILIDRATIQQVSDWFKWFHAGNSLEAVWSSKQCSTALRAALDQPALAQQQAAQSGYKLVPVEPTPEMRLKGQECLPGGIPGRAAYAADAYRAMVDAALPPNAAPEAPAEVREPLTDDWIRSRCSQTWVFDTVKRWVKEVETAHGITGSKE